jgi:hypothetical protein
LLSGPGKSVDGHKRLDMEVTEKCFVDKNTKHNGVTAKRLAPSGSEWRNRFQVHSRTGRRAPPTAQSANRSRLFSKQGSRSAPSATLLTVHGQPCATFSSRRAPSTPLSTGGGHISIPGYQCKSVKAKGFIIKQRGKRLPQSVSQSTQNVSIAQIMQPARLLSHTRSMGVLELDFLPAPPSSVPVGKRLQHSLLQWHRSIVDPFALSVVTQGYKIPLIRRPPLTCKAPLEAPVMNLEKASVIRQEVASLLQKGAIQPVKGTEPGFYSHMFLVRKSSGGWRPVMDLTRLNQYVAGSKFKMVTPANIRESVHQHD